MKFILILIALTLQVGCGHSNKSKLNAIVDQNKEWKEVYSNKYAANVYLIRNKDQILGNGFVIGEKDQYLITNSHVAVVVKYCKALRIDCQFTAENKNGVLNLTKKIKIDRINDVAHIQFDKSNKNLDHVDIKRANISKAHKIYLLAMIDSQTLIQSSGEIFKIGQPQVMLFQHNANTIKGMSGSPIFNDKYELVGIHKSSNLDQNLNIGINLYKVLNIN